MRGLLIPFFVLTMLAAAAAQTTPGDKKGEPAKGKDDAKANKEIEAGKPKDAGKDGPKPKVPLEKIPNPGTIIVVVDELREALSAFPEMMLLTPERYLELLERIKTLERQTKLERALPSSCKLTGVLDEDYLLFTAEIGFATQQPKTSVFLGLKGGHLLDEGVLDGQAPVLEYTDEGFVARVEKEGPHQMTLRFRVAAPVKKTAGGVMERVVKLELPGAAATVLDLTLSTNAENLVWNENPEKAKKPGHWQFGVGAGKSLVLSWREPVPLVGNPPLPKVEGQVLVRLDETHVNISAELFLEDHRSQTKEWLLFLPATAKIDEVKAPNGEAHPIVAPNEKSPHYRITKATPGRWHVSINQRVPRPNPGARVAIGPYQVVGVFQHLGTIAVQMNPDVTLGQRLFFTRAPTTYQVKNTEKEAVFQYTALPFAEKGAKAESYKAPLELELRADKNQLESVVEHAIKMKSVQHGLEIETTSKIKATALFSAFNAIDVKLPMPKPRGLSVIGTVAPEMAFPGNLPWMGLWKVFGPSWELNQIEDMTVLDDQLAPLKLVPLGGGKVHVQGERGPVKQMTVILKSSFVVTGDYRRIRLELPRPLNTHERSAKLSIQTDDRVELLHGPPGLEEPVPEHHHFDLAWDQTPAFVDLAWRPFQREVIAQATIDVTVYPQTAHVRQSLRFARDTQPAPGIDPKNQQVRLSTPVGVNKINVISGGTLTNLDIGRQALWVRPQAEGMDPIELVLEYDLVAGLEATALEGAGRWLAVTPVWPANASQKDVKVRLWSTTHAQPRLPRSFRPGPWKERSIEQVSGKNQFPSLVLQGYGPDVPLQVLIDTASPTPLAAFVADRALIHVREEADESQHCRARYWVRNIHAGRIELELPVPLKQFRVAPVIQLDKHRLIPEKKIGSDRIVSLTIPADLVDLPAILEITYAMPPEALERNTFWRTTLHAPAFQSEVVVGQMRWQWIGPHNSSVVMFQPKARADWQWTLQNWLPAPEPAVTGADLDAWLTGKESAAPAETLTYAFALVSIQPETVYHLPRHWALLICSGTFLIVALAGYFSAMPRWAFWLGLVIFALGLVTLALNFPTILPAAIYSLQPGVALFLTIIAIHWLIQERYKRQLVLMPGFTPAQSGSTLQRTKIAKPREASTLDAPEPPVDEKSSKSQGTAK